MRNEVAIVGQIRSVGMPGILLLQTPVTQHEPSDFAILIRSNHTTHHHQSRLEGRLGLRFKVAARGREVGREEHFLAGPRRLQPLEWACLGVLGRAVGRRSSAGVAGVARGVAWSMGRLVAKVCRHQVLDVGRSRMYTAGWPFLPIACSSRTSSGVMRARCELVPGGSSKAGTPPARYATGCRRLLRSRETISIAKQPRNQVVHRAGIPRLRGSSLGGTAQPWPGRC